MKFYGKLREYKWLFILINLHWGIAKGLYFTIASSLYLKIRQNFCDQLHYNLLNHRTAIWKGLCKIVQSNIKLTVGVINTRSHQPQLSLNLKTLQQKLTSLCGWPAMVLHHIPNEDNIPHVQSDPPNQMPLPFIKQHATTDKTLNLLSFATNFPIAAGCP